MRRYREVSAYSCALRSLSLSVLPQLTLCSPFLPPVDSAWWIVTLDDPQFNKKSLNVTAANLRMIDLQVDRQDEHSHHHHRKTCVLSISQEESTNSLSVQTTDKVQKNRKYMKDAHASRDALRC